MKKLITFFVFIHRWSISLFKREKKTLLKSLEESQIKHENEISDLNFNHGEVMLHIETELGKTQEALRESQRKKWYQFRRIE
jgi:hypothetical protein